MENKEILRPQGEDKVPTCDFCGCEPTEENEVIFYEACIIDEDHESDAGWWCDDCFERSRDMVG